MKKRKISLADIGIILGVLMVLVSAAVLIYTKQSQKTAAENSEEITQLLYSFMPEIEDSIPDDRINITMSTMIVQEESFCGVLEIPDFDTSLPICAVWQSEKVEQFPCRYLGSLYDGSLIVGCSSNKGQLDFANQIEPTTDIFITDMSGNRYSYEIMDIFRTEDVSTENLADTEADLVIFTKNKLSFDYTVVYCKFGY